MTVADLIRDLQELPPHLPVVTFNKKRPLHEGEIMQQAREVVEVRNGGRYAVIAGFGMKLQDTVRNNY